MGSKRSDWLKLCPKCKGKMVIRENHATGAKFMGCTNYPECRHTEQVPFVWTLREMGHPELPLVFEEEHTDGSN